MRWLLAPEPSEWLPTVLGRLMVTPADRLFAPWALHRPPPAWLGPRLRAAWIRRRADGVQVLTLPGWSVVEGMRRLYARSTAARYRSHFVLRQHLSRIAAQRLPRSVKTVIAPSLAARELFAVARRQGARCVLVEDLPSLRQLCSDLDRAAQQHPQARFLSNHRPSAAHVARQEAERLLADERWVRGPFTTALLAEAGLGSEPLVPRAGWCEVHEARPLTGRTLLLAGGATARAGVYEALAALEARPQWTLLARGGEGTEPVARRHPRVRLLSGAASLQGVVAVLAPAWSEHHAAELEAASREGVPVIASDRAAPWSGHLPIPVGDVGALVRARAGRERAGRVDG